MNRSLLDLLRGLDEVLKFAPGTGITVDKPGTSSPAGVKIPIRDDGPEPEKTPAERPAPAAGGSLASRAAKYEETECQED